MNWAEQQQIDIGRLVGSKYQVLCRIGGGGMAQVLLARHRLHGGLFAIKILSDHLAQDPSIVARFKQEATTAASLSGHPNIVSIFDIGEGDGLHYLIMQFVCGEDLSSYLRREGKLAPPAAAGVIAQTAEALAWAESKHVVHRDLKPANMHLDTSGRIKILDFGISKVTDIADGLTRPGESLGTPFYMSPEQIRGEGCDVRSDLYSLGVVFYELLTATRPFDNESATAVQMAHLSTPPPSLLTIDPGLPPMCDKIVQKLLRKNRAERYQTSQELLDDLYANGASSGPLTLRPVVDSGLQAEIDRAPHSPTDAPSSVCPPSPVEGALTGSKPANTPAPPSQTRPPARAPIDPPVSEAPNPKSSILIPAVAGSITLLLAILVGLLFFLRSNKPGAATTSSAPTTSQAASPPTSAVDAHGRMLLVPAGDFIFGDTSPDSPQAKQTVHLPDFYIDETEVSNAEYLQFVHATSRAFSNETYAAAHPDEPVTLVSQPDAASFATWAGKRLPTEQEWEKAARGTDGRPFPWGSEPWTENVPEHLMPVNSSPDRKSPYGALNMAGNAWEWTSSTYPASPADLARMRKLLNGAKFSTVWYSTKGGSFSPGGSKGFQVYLRRPLPEDGRSPWIGFRCAKDAGGT